MILPTETVMLVKDWMTKNPVTITDDTSMMKAIHLMKQHRFRRLPVMHDGELVGVVTDRDLKEASPPRPPPWMCMNCITCWRSCRSRTS